MPRSIWGIFGGMGPLASAEFVKTIYETDTAATEQGMPVVMLYSDPRLPDRTEAILGDQSALLLERFVAGLEQLARLNVTRVVVCCVTIHNLLDSLPPKWRGIVVSLVDVIYGEIAQSPKRHLLIATDGARKARIFENHLGFLPLRDRIVLPEHRDQHQLHQMIYEMKRNIQTSEQAELVEGLLRKYSVESYIAGCTEIHLLTKRMMQSTGNPHESFCVDPLMTLAREIARTASSAPDIAPAPFWQAALVQSTERVPEIATHDAD